MNKDEKIKLLRTSINQILPEFSGVLKEHEKDLGEILPHILVFSLYQFTKESFENKRKKSIFGVVNLLESLLGLDVEGDTYFEDLLYVSFFESLDTNEDYYIELKDLLKPKSLKLIKKLEMYTIYALHIYCNITIDGLTKEKLLDLLNKLIFLSGYYDYSLIKELTHLNSLDLQLTKFNNKKDIGEIITSVIEGKEIQEELRNLLTKILSFFLSISNLSNLEYNKYCTFLYFHLFTDIIKDNRVNLSKLSNIYE